MNNVKVVNPFNQEVIGTVEKTQWADLDIYLQQALELHQDKSQHLAAHERSNILMRCAQLMQQQKDELALLIANEGGKPLKDAIIEVTRAIDGVQLCVKELLHFRGEQVPMDLTAAGAGRLAFTYREPIGPVVAISAFNHPLNLIVHQIAPAVAIGCPVLIKPAVDTPLSAQRFVKLLHQAGLEEKWCRFFICDRVDAERLVSDPRTAFFSFIGSASVGWHLRSKLAPGTRCALEHGGAAPVVIDETADIETLIPLLVKGGFYHSGQVCVSVQRIYVHKSIARKIALKLAEQASQLIVGDAKDPNTDCGPLIRAEECKRVSEWVEEARESGAEIVCGGKVLSATTYSPTVIYKPDDQLKVSQLEVFGPVVCVYEYEDIEEAFKRANNVRYSFQASVFTNRLDIALKAQRELEAAAVMVNDHSAFRVDWMPFAGRKQSGYGVGGIAYTMLDMSEEKMVVIKMPELD